MPKASRKDEAIKALLPPMLIGQLDEVRDNSGKPVRILIHQAVACPFELNQPGVVYSLGENKCILRGRS